MVNMKYISQRLRQKLRNILPKPPRSIENIAMAPKLSHLIGQSCRKITLPLEKDAHIWLNPSIVRIKGGYFCTIKGMNYDLKKIWFDHENWSRTRDEGVIETVNDILLLGENFEIKDRVRLDVSDLTGGNELCIVEDIRLAQYEDKVIALGVIGLDHEVAEESGKLISTLKTARTFIAEIEGNKLTHSRVIDSPSGVARDKNWVMSSRPKTSAFRICTNLNSPGTIILDYLHNACSAAETKIESLKWTGGWSGSTNLVPFAGENIAIIHRSRQNPLVYEHLMVICDDSFKIKRISAPFTFEGQPIEFCCGLERSSEEKIVIGYCTWDESILAEYPIDVLDGFCRQEVLSNSDVAEAAGMRPV